MNTYVMPQRTLGQRMRELQLASEIVLPKNNNILQLDGKSFSKYTKNFVAPFDVKFIDAMDVVAAEVLKAIPGSAFAYVQSDEINILLKPASDIDEKGFYGNRQVKLVSLAAATASVAFSRMFPEFEPALFDARVFTMPDETAVHDFFVWRQRDCVRNSVSMVAGEFFSPKKLDGVKTKDRLKMLDAIGQSWDDYPAGQRTGRIVKRTYVERDFEFVHKGTGEVVQTRALRSTFTPVDAPVFTDLVSVSNDF